jgi:hypothetical protein
VDVDVELASPEKFESDETVEKLRSGEGQEEMAGVGEREGEGEPSRRSMLGSMAW